jgi:hypothetical protein
MEDISLGGFDWSGALRVLGGADTPGHLPALDLRRGFDSLSGSGFKAGGGAGEHEHDDGQSAEAPRATQTAAEVRTEHEPGVVEPNTSQAWLNRTRARRG